jgi:tRNA-Thr(GGU) m(6)t(6)A37 methyltransferase TsaA
MAGGTDAEKLKVLIEYWVSHNREHIEENEKWLLKVRKLGLEDVAHRLKHVIELSETINEQLEHAKRSLVEQSIIEPASSDHARGIHRHDEPHGHRHVQLHQIGIIRTPYTHKVPHQPVEDEQGDFRIILDEEYSEGLYKLETFTYIYVLFYLDRRSHTPSLLVTPHWAGGITVGLFASRSPDRPSPIGLSVVRIELIERNIIHISSIDAYDGTPLLDIKPYIENIDCKTGAGNGWAQNVFD